MSAHPDVDDTLPSPPEQLPAASSRRHVIRMHPLLSRAATELQTDSELRRVVVIGLMRSLGEQSSGPR
jgi:hypothetical protein